MKIKPFQDYLIKEKIDLAFFYGDDPSIVYFTQQKPTHSFLIINKEETDFYISRLDQVNSRKELSVHFIEKDWENKLINKKVKKVGISKNYLTISNLERLQRIYPNAKFVDITLIIRNLRSTKTAAEIKNITTACNITVFAFRELIEELSKGTLKTELQVASFLETEIKRKGGGIAFPTIVATAKNSAIPHHITSKAKLRKGFLLLDFGASYSNYCSDMTRVLYLGRANKQEKETYKKLLKVQESSINEISYNRSLSDLDEFTRKNLGNLSSYFIHSLGHGVGIEIHEEPRISPESKDNITRKQVFTIEPGVYFPNKFGLRIEDTVLFDDKAKILTKATKKLLEVPF